MEEGSFNEGEAFFQVGFSDCLRGKERIGLFGVRRIRQALSDTEERGEGKKRKEEKEASEWEEEKKEERKKDWDNKKGKPPRKWEGRLSGRTRKESWPRGLVWFGLV
ncbi:hypothetical protein BO86DRAFT_13151 [Aspergillus japonicus CBS 114.51]|uniref:Uncharacterized protein n=1 Tax=Aspergillus japonicus CBS 114.51 TaxID=1448312 RepID=A0A8T8X7I9_ASPJA|nr:hypothetical protein BO86DRAFT_13151 [Aspergillus japonicus CBS 114.51]RAH84127.1 hypothetical protein BO86DRAFT_13151 [Aspergillus japonicus CBS 114.51]